MSLESLVIELALVEATQLDCSWLVLANSSLSLPHLQYSATKVPEHIHEKKLFTQNEKCVLDFQRKYATKAPFSP